MAILGLGDAMVCPSTLSPISFGQDRFQHTGAAEMNRRSELLYFSLVTLSTIGYGDVVPVSGEARMLAALEGVTGVLYVAITVALLVSAYKQQGTSGEPPP